MVGRRASCVAKAADRRPMGQYVECHHLLTPRCLPHLQEERTRQEAIFRAKLRELEERYIANKAKVSATLAG